MYEYTCTSCSTHVHMHSHLISTVFVYSTSCVSISILQAMYYKWLFFYAVSVYSTLWMSIRVLHVVLTSAWTAICRTSVGRWASDTIFVSVWPIKSMISVNKTVTRTDEWMNECFFLLVSIYLTSFGEQESSLNNSSSWSTPVRFEWDSNIRPPTC